MKTKRKIVSLVIALVLVVSMAAIPSVAGAVLNQPPIANAGPDQAVHESYTYPVAVVDPVPGTDVTLGAYPLVTLDGSWSLDLNPGDTLTYSWLQTGGGAVVLSDLTAIQPTFTPLLGVADTYEFELTVTDDGAPSYSTMDTVRVYAGKTWFVRISPSDDLWSGDSYYRWPIDAVGPFRTITRAVDAASTGDRILVGPTAGQSPNHYGGDTLQTNEQIKLDVRLLTLQSLEGAYDNDVDLNPVTLIDVSEQNFGDPSWLYDVDQVVEITRENVTLGCDGHGFTLSGACTGIWAHNGRKTADFVYIHQNYILLDDCCEEATGIIVEDSKTPIVDDNIIDIQCTLFGIGIVLDDCDASAFNGAQVTNNTVTVDAEEMGDGIVLVECPGALVHNNTVTVTVGPSYGLGIGLYDGSDLATVTENDVTVTVSGGTWAAGFGIEVMDSERVTVGGPESLRNTVNVAVSVFSGEFGGHLAIGIHLWHAAWADVDNNFVNVLGHGVASLGDMMDGGRGVASLSVEELDGLQQVADEIFGSQFSMSLSAGVVLGILAGGSDYIDVTGNDVTADVDLTISVVDSWLAVGAGAGLSFGIVVLFSDLADVIGNIVDADAYIYLDVSAADPSFFPMEESIGGALAAAHGIVAALGYGPEVSGNEVDAYGDVDAFVISRGGLFVSEESDSVIGKLDSEVLSVVYDIVTDSLESEEVGAQIIGDPKAALFTIAGGGALGAGIGITTMFADGAQVTSNVPVIGRGNVDATVYAMEWSLGGIVTASGAGLGLGIGILGIHCEPIDVSSNLVTGYGDANVDGQAAIVGLAGLAAAESSGAGVGLGILLIGGVNHQIADEVDNDNFMLPPCKTNVVGNIVAAEGKGNVTAAAYEQAFLGDAFAEGHSVGLGMGIVVLGHWCPAIVGNTVGLVQEPILGEARADVYAAGISAIDPFAWGVSKGIGIGIMVMLSPGAYIAENTAIAVGDAWGEVTAIEEMLMISIVADADGTSIGAGIGMVLAMSPYARVTWNTATGTGYADVSAIAAQMEPVDRAEAFALGVGIGKGIAILCLHKAFVQESNVFEGGGNVVIDAEATGDIAYQGKLGLAIGLDAFILGVGYVAFNYNDMPGLNPSIGNEAVYVQGGPLVQFNADVLIIDWGMLALMAGHIDARYNWWGDESGPDGMGYGVGQAIVWCMVCYPEFMPWLYAEHEDMLITHIGKYGFAVCVGPSGLSSFSTPFDLNLEYNTWNELRAFHMARSMDFPAGPITGFNGDIQQWILPVVATDLTLEPLDGYYIFGALQEEICIILLADVNWHFPQKPVYEDPVLGSWNLIAPNPLICESGIPVEQAISSIGGAFGHVVSHSAPEPDWYYSRWQFDIGEGGPMMNNGRAYWLWMLTDGLLNGVGFTPIGLYPCNWKGNLD